MRRCVIVVAKQTINNISEQKLFLFSNPLNNPLFIYITNFVGYLMRANFYDVNSFVFLMFLSLLRFIIAISKFTRHINN